MKMGVTVKKGGVAGMATRPCTILYSMMTLLLFMKRLPFEVIQHLCDTVHLVVVSHHKSCGRPLNHFYLEEIRSWVCGSHTDDEYSRVGRTCLVGQFLDLWRAFSEVATKKAKGGVALVARLG